ncbi:hypothetical protein D3C86_1395000 [compost metagenome]
MSRLRSHRLHKPVKIISMPRPTMIRNDQNTMVEFGRSSGGNSLSAGTCLSSECVRIRLPRYGISTANLVFSSFMSGQPNRISGVASLPLFSQWPSIAAIFAG